MAQWRFIFSSHSYQVITPTNCLLLSSFLFLPATRAVFLALNPLPMHIISCLGASALSVSHAFPPEMDKANSHNCFKSLLKSQNFNGAYPYPTVEKSLCSSILILLSSLSPWKLSLANILNDSLFFLMLIV